MQRSTIEWTDYTSNPLRARRIATAKLGHHCVKVSEECDQCYSEAINNRFGTRLRFTKAAQAEVEMILDEKELLALQKLNQRSARRGEKPYVFACDMTDLFQQAVSDEQLDRLFEVAEACTHLRFQLLTKRAVRMQSYLARRWADGAPSHLALGVSVGLPKTLWRFVYLRHTPAALRFASCEPLLAKLNLRPWLPHAFQPDAKVHCQGCAPLEHEWNFPRPTASAHGPFLDWVITGGESGQRARPTNLDHLDSVVQQCFDTDTPVFVKQLGTKPFYFDDATNRPTPFPISDGKGGAMPDFPCHFVRQMPDGTER